MNCPKKEQFYVITTGYLVDVTSHLNYLNLKPQSKNKLFPSLVNDMNAFTLKHLEALAASGSVEIFIQTDLAKRNDLVIDPFKCNIVIALTQLSIRIPEIYEVDIRYSEELYKQ
ncbi:Hypothetical predicted protein [Octopus vulgaris]|uniref:Uncharacterized protein n=1 Tax=Octopus vulgaris TaxID=6645 RepID=A0AA36B787_OCTVU|nr:Hypothetical predicted protein [Octopus vulgaris]